MPALIGSNADEGSRLTGNGRAKAAVYRQQVVARFGPDADSFLTLYPFQSDTEAAKAQADAMRDQRFGWEMRKWARMQTKTGKSKVYLYYLSRVPPGPDAPMMRAFHTSEIAYVFDNVNGKTGYAEPFFRTPGNAHRPWQDMDRKLADAMSSFWVNFATTGDPNRKGLPEWQPYQTGVENATGLGDQNGIMPLPNKDRLDLMDRFFDRMRKAGQLLSFR